MSSPQAGGNAGGGQVSPHAQQAASAVSVLVPVPSPVVPASQGSSPPSGTSGDGRSPHSSKLTPHRARMPSDSEYQFFSTRRPSLLTVLAITLFLIIFELEIIVTMREAPAAAPPGLRAGAGVGSGAAEGEPCEFSWNDVQCSPGCCLRSFQRKASQTIVMCETCTAGEASLFASGDAAKGDAASSPPESDPPLSVGVDSRPSHRLRPHSEDHADEPGMLLSHGVRIPDSFTEEERLLFLERLQRLADDRQQQQMPVGGTPRLRQSPEAAQRDVAMADLDRDHDHDSDYDAARPLPFAG